MKTKLFLLITITSAIILLSSQNTNAQWSLMGNTLSSNAKLGTLNKFSLQVYTSGKERMHIDTGGLVGIGTIAPLQKLHVNGNINMSANYGLYIDNKRVLSINGTANLFAGENAGKNNTTGSYNTAVGSMSLSGAVFVNKGSNNTATGFSSLLSNSTGSFNTANGSLALYSNGVGSNNTASGYQSLYSNTTGDSNTANGFSALHSNNTGSRNTATGANALFYNKDGNENTADGYAALFSNMDGSDNTADGFEALFSNTSGYGNTASGYKSMFFNIAGTNNTATGYQSLYSCNSCTHNTADGFKTLYSNTSGYSNSALGALALYSNNGSENTACGAYAAYNNTTGYDNVALGRSALYSNITGHDNTAIGGNADVKYSNLFNATALGFGAVVDNSNKVRIGNVSVTSIGGQVGWTTFSDGRYNKNIKEDVQGLAFINRLRPVTYTMDINGLNKYYNEGRKSIAGKKEEQEDAAIQKSADEAGKIIYNGFVAQEVEAAAQKLHYNFSGVDKPKSDNGLYGLRYGDFVVPLVKAVQELSKQNDSLKTELDKIKQVLTANNTQQNSVAIAASGFAQLEQNNPNPFTNATSISYNLPTGFKSAKIIIADMNGKVIKQVQLTTPGKGIININTYNLSSGAYSYSLIIDGKFIESKKMVVEK